MCGLCSFFAHKALYLRETLLDCTADQVRKRATRTHTHTDLKCHMPCIPNDPGIYPGPIASAHACVGMSFGSCSCAGGRLRRRGGPPRRRSLRRCQQHSAAHTTMNMAVASRSHMQTRRSVGRSAKKPSSSFILWHVCVSHRRSAVIELRRGDVIDAHGTPTGVPFQRGGAWG